ncbi:unnamed protein product, partial [Oppiella nova]
MNIEDIVALHNLVSIKIYSLQKENSNLVQQVIKFKTFYDKNKTDENETKDTESESMDTLADDKGFDKDNLLKEVERIKKKYSIKSKKLEQKMVSMSQRNRAHSPLLWTQIKTSKNKTDENETKDTESESMDTLADDKGFDKDNLLKEVERIKKKYSIKSKKLEQKMVSMSQRNRAHVRHNH